MRYWWVNQNQTYRAEVRGNFMWSPKQKADGGRNQFYENMRAVEPGDIVFSYWNTRIQAVGIAGGSAETGPKPDFGTAGSNWANEGWFVPVDYRRVENPIRPKEHIEILRPFLPAIYSPLRPNGDGLQAVYLAEVPTALAEAIKALMGQAYFDALADIEAYRTPPHETELDETIVERGIVGPTFRNQLIKARRGQGVFRSNVLLHETECRVTRVSEPHHLKASHIKPWRDASDVERLDGSNGLLLSPHVDHLFDEGYVTFSASQSLLVVPEVKTELLDAWGIDAGVHVGEFSREQQAFLDYHRANVFRGGPLGDGG